MAMGITGKAITAKKRDFSHFTKCLHFSIFDLNL